MSGGADSTRARRIAQHFVTYAVMFPVYLGFWYAVEYLWGFTSEILAPLGLAMYGSLFLVDSAQVMGMRALERRLVRALLAGALGTLILALLLLFGPRTP